MKLAGMKPNTILLHERVPSAHKNGLVNFAYADGSVRTLTPAEAKWAISELAAGFNPPRAINSVPATSPSR
jgi:prepilin-type processing-associated H-X9-DG protein